MATMTPQQIAVIIQAQLGTSFQATTQQVNTALAALGANANAAGGQAAAGLGLSNQQLMNMQFQMNDMAVMLASGQNPFILIMQQGMQIVQTLDSSKGITGALKAIGAGFVSFITNPLNLMVAGIAAAAGAVALVFNSFSRGSVSITDAMDRHADTMDRVRDAYDGARSAGEQFSTMTRTAALATIAEDNRMLAQSIRETTDALVARAQPLMTQISLLGQVANENLQVRIAMTYLNSAVAAGNLDLDALHEYLARAVRGMEGLHPEVQSILRDLFALSEQLVAAKGDMEENTAAAAALEAGVRDLDEALAKLGNSLPNIAKGTEQALTRAREQMEAMARAAGGDLALGLNVAEVEQQAAEIRKGLEAGLSGPELDAALAELDATVAARLEAIRRGAERSAGSAGAAITEVFRTEADAARDAFDEIEQLLSFQVQTYQITNQQRLAQLRAAKDEELRIIVDALSRQLAVEGLSADQRARINADIEEAERDHQRAMAEIIQTGIADQMKLVEDRWNSFTSSITSAIQGLLRGTMTLGDAIKSVLADMVLRWIEAIRKMVVQWVIGQRAKTASAAAGAAARTSIAAGEAAATAGVERLGIIRSILSRAREVFAKVFSFMAPVMGPAAAAPAAASQAAVAAQAAIPLAVGAWDIPRDMLALVHKGETVVPRTFAEGMREGGGTFGGKSIAFHYHAPARGGGNTGFWRREAAGMFDAFEEEARRRNIWTPQTARG